MQERSLKNRTLWHSGLLLILLYLSIPQCLAKVQLTVGSHVVSKSGDVVILGEGEDTESSSLVVVKCALNDDNQFKSIQWKLNDQDLETKNVIASDENRTFNKDQLDKSLNKIECLVKIQDIVDFWSYTFVYIAKSQESGQEEENDSSIALSFLEGSSEVNLGGRVSLKCKVDQTEGQQHEFQWIKNAKPLDLAKSKSFDLKVISGKFGFILLYWPGRLKPNEWSWHQAGNLRVWGSNPR